MKRKWSDPAQARETIEQMADGTVDIVIGTHRLLANNVKFKNLSLGIVALHLAVKP